MYKCKHFKIYELVPPSIYNKYKDTPYKMWLMFDDRVLREADKLRDKFGSCTINNWYWGGDFSQSGIRTPESRYYKETSQHSFGRALDLKFNSIRAEEVRKYIKENPSEFPLIKGLEDFKGMTWVHIDTRNAEELQIFKG